MPQPLRQEVQGTVRSQSGCSQRVPIRTAQVRGSEGCPVNRVKPCCEQVTANVNGSAQSRDRAPVLCLQGTNRHWEVRGICASGQHQIPIRRKFEETDVFLSALCKVACIHQVALVGKPVNSHVRTGHRGSQLIRASYETVLGEGVFLPCYVGTRPDGKGIPRRVCYVPQVGFQETRFPQYHLDL